MWQISRPHCRWCKFGQVFKIYYGKGIQKNFQLYTNWSGRELEWQYGPFVNTSYCQTAQNGRFWKNFGQSYLKFNLSRGHFYKKFGLRVTEFQTPKGTQYTGRWNFFVPDFNKLPDLLRLQGDYTGTVHYCKISQRLKSTWFLTIGHVFYSDSLCSYLSSSRPTGESVWSNVRDNSMWNNVPSCSIVRVLCVAGSFSTCGLKLN